MNNNLKTTIEFLNRRIRELKEEVEAGTGRFTTDQDIREYRAYVQGELDGYEIALDLLEGRML